MNPQTTAEPKQVGNGWKTWVVTHPKILALSTLGLGAFMVAGWFALPVPSAQGALKGRSVEMYRNADIRVVFDQRMDETSVERAFRVTPPVEGSFSWDQNALRFDPAQDLEKGAVYQVEIADSAKSIFQKPLSGGFTQTVTVLDYPEVAAVSPSDKSVIRPSQTLTVMFDHPLRNLSAQVFPPANPLQISPRLDGTVRWLGTSGFEFIPDKGWTPATEFTVTVPKGTKTADGGETIADYSWRFSTDGLSITNVNLGALKPNGEIVIQASHLISAAEVKRAGELKMGNVLVASSDWSVEADSEPTVLKIKLKGGYQLGKSYSFSLPKGFTGGVGQLGLASTFFTEQKTDELGFRVKDRCPNPKESIDYQGSVAWKLNNPIDPKTIQDRIVVEPAVKDLNVRVTSWYYCPMGDQNADATDRVLYIEGKWKPSTTYTITVKDGVMDVYGQRLVAEKSTFRTDKIASRVDMATNAPSGMLASHLPRLYQVRSVNATGELEVELCTKTLADQLANVDGCAGRSTARMALSGKENEFRIQDIDLDTVSGKSLPNGFYRLRLRHPLLNWNSGYANRDLVISDTALLWKLGKDGSALVWATDLKTGQPVSNMMVSAYLPGAQSTAFVATTDREGIAKLQISNVKSYENLKIVGTTREGRLGYVETEWNDGISPWNYQLDADWQRGDQYIGHVYADRQIYRPDQTVYFKGVIRNDHDATLQLPSAKTATVSITSSEGKTIYSKELPFSAYGSFFDEVALTADADLGSYTISATVPQKGGEVTQSVVGSFEVREYRRPDFKVNVELPREAVVAGGQLQLPIEATYYHGTPLANAIATYQINRNRYLFQGPRNEWFSFSRGFDDGCWWYCRSESNLEFVSNGEVVLDAQGRGMITVLAELSQKTESATYFVTVTVRDINGRDVSANVEVPVHKGLIYAGIRPNYDAGWDSTDVAFDVIALGVDEKPRANQRVTVILYKRTWGESTESDFGWEKKDTEVTKTSVTTDARGRVVVSFGTQASSGEFVGVVSVADSGGRIAEAEATRYVWGSDAGRISEDQQMPILQTKAEYSIGDVASLAAKLPFDATKALVTVERGTVRSYRVVDLTMAKNTIDIPITEDLAPNAYVSIAAVRGTSTGLPEFRMGYAELAVETSKKQLGITLNPNKQIYRPGEEVTLKIKTTKSDGSSVPAEVSIAVVDERVVALLGSIDKNILGKFWFQRLLGVGTAESLTRLVKKVFYAVEGGGGGKGAGETVVRGNFLDTAFWKANVVTDANGEATATFKLPDNLTSWQILAIGATKDSIVGSSEVSVISRRELMAEPLLPRVLRFGDVANIGATVVNATDQTVRANVTLSALDQTGLPLSVTSKLTQSVSVPAKGRVPIRWTVTAPKRGSSVTFTVVAKGNGLEDGFTQTLPVLPASVAEVYSTSGELKQTVTERVQMPDDIDPNAGELKVTVSPHVGASLSGGLEYLLDYEYGCAEQTTSAILASLSFEELLDQNITTSTPAMREKAKTKVDVGLRRLQSMQRPDGGMAYWPDSQESYAHLSAYVYQGLVRAQKAGHSVDEDFLNRLESHLRARLTQVPSVQTPWYSRFDAYERATVLAAMSERDSGGLRDAASVIYARRSELGITGKAALATAYARIEKGQSSARAQELLKEIHNQVIWLDTTRAYVKDDVGGYYYGSNVKATAAYLEALLATDPKHGDVAPLVRWLVTQKSDGYWETTHSTAWAFLTLAEYAKQFPVDLKVFAVNLFWNGKPSAELVLKDGDRSSSVSKSIPMSELVSVPTHEIGLEQEGNRRGFYDVNLKVYRDAVDVPAMENGFSVVSEIFRMDDVKRLESIATAKVGDTVRVRMKLLVQKDHELVAWEHHLPAGLEPIDFTLKTSPQTIAGEAKQCVPGWDGKQECWSGVDEWWWENVWNHIEFRDDRVFLFADRLKSGVYEYEFLAKAVTPGTFRLPPARAYEFYAPSYNGHSAGGIFQVKE